MRQEVRSKTRPRLGSIGRVVWLVAVCAGLGVSTAAAAVPGDADCNGVINNADLVAVVKAIFLVIVLDALFSILFEQLGI